ncbi:hypothetical protein [Streptomyces sp. NPDC058812]
MANWYAWCGSSGLAGIFFDDALGDCGRPTAHRGPGGHLGLLVSLP